MRVEPVRLEQHLRPAVLVEAVARRLELQDGVQLDLAGADRVPDAQQIAIGQPRGSSGKSFEDAPDVRCKKSGRWTREGRCCLNSSIFGAILMLGEREKQSAGTDSLKETTRKCGYSRGRCTVTGCTCQAFVGITSAPCSQKGCRHSVVDHLVVPHGQSAEP